MEKNNFLEGHFRLVILILFIVILIFFVVILAFLSKAGKSGAL